MKSNTKRVCFCRNNNNAVRVLKPQNTDKWHTGANKNEFKTKGCTEICLYIKENITTVMSNVRVSAVYGLRRLLYLIMQSHRSSPVIGIIE